MAVICTPDMGCTQAMITRDKATAFSNDISKASLEKIPDDVVQPPMNAMPEVLDDIASDVTAGYDDSSHRLNHVHSTA
jgi:hypothetical protein